jgi:hypothetical protein
MASPLPSPPRTATSAAALLISPHRSAALLYTPLRSAPCRVTSHRFVPHHSPSPRLVQPQEDYMLFFNVSIKGITPYSQSRVYEVDREQGEGADDYARRTWRNYMHVTKQGEVFIPPNAFKNCLSETAKYMNIGIPGKGKSTYTKHFEAGIQVVKPVLLGIKAADVICEKLFLPANGERGGKKRVWKYYPRMDTWGGDIEVLVLDETVLQTSKTTGQPILHDVCTGAGQFVGLGRFRPRQNGFYGRFDIVSFGEAKMAKAA